MLQYFKIPNNEKTNDSNDFFDITEIERANWGFANNGFTGFGSLDNLKDFDSFDSHILNHSFSLPNFRLSEETCIPAPVAHLPNTKSAYNMRLQAPQDQKSLEQNSDFESWFANDIDSKDDINSLQNISDSTFLQICLQYSINPHDLKFTPKIFWDNYEFDNEYGNDNDNNCIYNENNNDFNNNKNAKNSNDNNYNENNMYEINDHQDPKNSCIRFDKIVTDFFRSSYEQNFNFFDKLNNCIKLISFSRSFIPLVGIEYANDYIFKINVSVFSRLIGIKDGMNYLFDQNGALEKLGFKEINDIKVEDFSDHIDLEGVDFINTKLFYHPDKLLAKNVS
ncbi:hypothetical protein M9Y10_002392 [Tritrichomonas musculus]|uniref:Initiator binding domain-containing protein n=1 Tax=Tritrichomonas musculus TaxID=1915356 RepID=A0ABR2L9N3_9EUKA